MSFGVILLFYAIFINYLISKKKKRNFAEFNELESIDKVGIDSINLNSVSSQSRNVEKEINSMINEKDFASVIRHIQNTNRFISRRSKVKKEYSENENLVDLRWFNNN